MKMHKEIRTRTGGIQVIHIERTVRESGYGMASYHCHPYFELQELLLLCSRICVFSQDAPADIHTTDHQVLLAARFISKNYMRAITTADIAEAAGFSPNYFSRKFRESAGIGVHEYLAYTRLRHAVAKLLGTDDTITQIALRCGFSDGNYFKDAFKKKYGVTPSEYRKESSR